MNKSISSMSNMGICNLCLEKKTLSKKSHIIPRFIQRKSVNKDKNGFYAINPSTKKQKLIFDGGYDKYIMCIDCDRNILSQYENYASKFLYKGLRPNEKLKITEFEAFHLVENIDYTLLKLYCLSLLWRFSISNKYPTVELSKIQNEYLRDVLLNKKSTLESDFPVLIWQSIRDTNIPNDLILFPWIDSNGNSFHFIAHGIQLQIFLNNTKLSEFYEESKLHENGSIKIIKSPPSVLAKIINKLSGVNWLKEK